MKTRIELGVIASTLLVLLSACDDGGSSDSSSTTTTTNSSIRLANATKSGLVMNGVGSSDTAVTFTTPTIAANAVSDYSSITAQTYTLGVATPGGSLTPSTQSLGLTGDVKFTLLSFERGGAVNTYTLVDNQTTPAASFANVLIANAGGDAGSLDVYLVSSNASLNGVAPVFTAIVSKSTSIGRVIAAGTYDVVVTASGKPSDVRLSIPAVTFDSTEVVTIALTSTIGGALVDGQIIKQSGAMLVVPSTTARIRVVGAFPASGSSNSTVSVVIGGTTLAPLTAPSVGAYRTVPAGTTNYSVSIDGIAVASLPAFNFQNGGDYTVLVAGTPGVPNVSVLADNNQPSINGGANIRLINAAVPSTTTLSVNFVPANIDVAYGQASEYSPTSPLSTSLLQITSPLAAFSTYTLNNVNITSGSIYTVFMLGTAANPIVSLSKDR